jgi:zinc transporter ZupT
MFYNVAIFSLIAGFSTISGVYLVRRFEEWTKRNAIFLISFAIGVLLATAFFHLLPEAIEINPTWFYWTLGAIIFLFLIEHFVIIHSCREGECDTHALGTISFLGLGIVFHSLIDGIIIGVGFGVSFVVGLLASLSVILHETAEGVFIYTLLIQDKKFQNKALPLSWIVALATPFGATAAFLFVQEVSSVVLSWLLAAAAGSFIYIGASDLVPEIHKKFNFLNIFLVLAGIAFVFIIGRFLG